MHRLAIAGCVMLASSAIAQIVQPVTPQRGQLAFPFSMSQVTLSPSRFGDNQDRTLTYLKFVDTERMLYVFRANHNVSTNGATPNGNWDDPTFPFRGHVQGHFLTAWSQCFAQLGDSECQDRAINFVAALAECQANNAVSGYAAGYLSGFPENDFTLLETGKLTNGNVPWYVMHKTMQGLLDVWQFTGDTTAKTVLLNLAGWVDTRTAKLSYSNMQAVLNTEFGGMNDVLTEIYSMTGDVTWLTTAQRFDHAATFIPLSEDQDILNGLHANTQVPKWIGATKEFMATANETYRDIALNAWTITTSAHTYAMGGNSEAEHFHTANAISEWLDNDTSEGCNTYNMLKLTRQLFMLNPSDSTFFDFYERALINHMLGQQNPADAHGHITYFTPLNPGGMRGVGPAWGGGTWSTDYDSFWCCQGTALETNSKYQDSIYFWDHSSLFVNLFTPSVLSWTARRTTITQTTTFPVGDTTTLTLGGSRSSAWDMKIRIPSWTSGASIAVNGVSQHISAKPGTFAKLSRTWHSGDVVTITLPMSLRLIPTNDNPAVAAVAFGPSVLAANYGTTSFTSNPTLDLGSLSRTSDDSLNFTGTANGASVDIGPFFDAQGFNYVVYWATSGSLPSN